MSLNGVTYEWPAFTVYTARLPVYFLSQISYLETKESACCSYE
jgi:hypothetical protein